MHSQPIYFCLEMPSLGTFLLLGIKKGVCHYIIGLSILVGLGSDQENPFPSGDKGKRVFS